VQDTRDGTRRLYRIDPGGIERLRAYFERFWDDALAQMKATAERDEGGGA
jgi:hypothetical protein